MKVNYNKQELKALKEAYFTARALFETIKTTAEGIQKSILEKHHFCEDTEKSKIFSERGRGKEDTRILNPFDSYLMSDSDFEKYLDLCYAEYQKAGIDDKRGRCYIPEAESREHYSEARKMLVDFGISIIPDEMTEKETLRNAVKNIKYRDKVLELVLTLEC